LSPSADRAGENAYESERLNETHDAALTASGQRNASQVEPTFQWFSGLASFTYSEIQIASLRVVDLQAFTVLRQKTAVGACVKL